MSQKLLAVAATALLLFILSVSFVFAQTNPPDRVRVLRESNLRAGPGTGFAIVGAAGAGSEFAVLGCNAACTWYELGPERWIAAFLVEPVTEATATIPAPTITATTPSVVETDEVESVEPSGTPAAPATTGSVRSTAISNSNLRRGPGTNFPVVGRAPAGQELEIVGRNEAGTWLLVSSGGWIAAFLVNDAPGIDSLPVFDETTAASTVASTAVATASLTARATSQATITGTPTSSVCDWGSYPTVCILRYPPDLECSDVFYRNFEVRPPDPHNFDEDGNGIGCEDSSLATPTPTIPSPTATPTPTPPPTTAPLSQSTGVPTPPGTSAQPIPPLPGTTQPQAEPSAAPEITPTQLAASAEGCDCSADLYQCADFETQGEAQACYEQCIAQGQGDIHRINIDNDALACENLP